jgi:3-isopropylmalate dehydratase small subunit
MGTEMGVIILLFPPNQQLLNEIEKLSGKKFDMIEADPDAEYVAVHEIDVTSFKPMLALPGHPHDNEAVEGKKGTKIDSAFIGSCTNGRMEDMRIAAAILKGRKVAPGVVMKIVPSTNEIWNKCLEEGLVQIFKDAGAMVSNAGCAGCAAGQVGQNGPDEVTLSTGNRNFAGKQGKGFVYLASPAIVAASAVAGFITTPDAIPEKPAEFTNTGKFDTAKAVAKERIAKPNVVEGKVWFIEKDDIDTDMIFHNRYLTITDIKEMGQYSFDNLKGYEDFAKRANPTDIVVTTKNFGAGSSRQQAVDCFKSLGISCIIAESFGAIYERNAINAAMPILTYKPGQMQELGLKDGDVISVNFETGEVINKTSGKTISINPFYPVQLEIYQNDGLL